MTNRDLLDEAIETCERLRNIEYHITIGKNNSETQIILFFPIDRFPHMIDFHKATDVNYLNVDERSRERMYETVLNNVDDIRDKIINSSSINDIIPRLDAINSLEELLDSNKEAYYSKTNYYGDFNNIDYDFAIHFKEDDFYMSFYFIKHSSELDKDRYVMVSTFEKNEPRGHCRRPHTLLKKIKINKLDRTSETLFEIKK